MVKDGHGSVVLLGALDTKGDEYAFVRERLMAAGTRVLLVDTGVLGDPTIVPDITRAEVATAAKTDLDALVRSEDRSAAMITMGRGAARLVGELHDQGIVGAVMMLGGSNAGFVMSRVCAVLPIGIPKVLVSTIVAGDTRPYIGASDMTMIYPVVDIAGLNSISIPILARAVDACAGMVLGPPIPRELTGIRAVGCTMFGVTTPCVTQLQERLMGSGAEVQIFHANGAGGLGFEAMVRSGLFAAVADVTTTELADELLGGVCSAGPKRLTAAASCGIPQIVSVGALDMVNFGAPGTVPERFAGRLFHPHNPAVTLMRTSEEECAELGRIIADRLNASVAHTEVHIPARGFSQISEPGAPFHNPEADHALISALQLHLDSRIPMRLHDLTINDPGFAHEVFTATTRALASREVVHE